MSEEEKNKALTNYALKRNFEIEQADKERNKKIQDATDEANKKLKEKQDAAHKQRLEKEKEHAKEIASLIANLTDERNKIRLSEFDYQVSLLDKERETRLKLAKGNDELIRQIELNYFLKLEELRKKEKTDVEKTEQDKTTLAIDATKILSAGVIQSRQQTTEFLKADNQIRIKLTESEIQAAEGVANTLGNLANLIGEQTVAGKILSVAQATISTFVSAQKAYESTIGIPVVGPVLAPINAAIAVATGIANVKKILSVNVPGKGSGGGSAPSPTNVARPAPVQPQAQTTRIDQGQINQIGNAAVRSYVLETDVANNQERRIRIERAARIG
jgi:hypothetical protein